MTRPRLLDLFCGAGGAAMGYHRAGFDVVGVDIKLQPRYPFEFIQADALEVLDDQEFLSQFDAVHVSPPCQAFTVAKTIKNREHPDLLTPTREALKNWAGVWVIENVPGSPMRPDVMLCGSVFGLEVERHRWFEFGVPHFEMLHPCRHLWPLGRPVGVYGSTGSNSNFDPSRRGRGNEGWLVADWRRAMGIDWMTGKELAQAIPPAYTEFIGECLFTQLAAEVTS